MTSAVLKNRLLNITNGEFSQSRYGSPSFIHLVRRVPDLLEIVRDNAPFRLRIISPVATETSMDALPESGPQSESENAFSSLLRGDLRRVRIRDDLWHAIIDYSSGNIYVIDSDTGLARPQAATDLNLPQLPTVSREEVSSWRHEFVESLDPSVRARFNDELEDWIEGGGRRSDLPGSARAPWAAFLKRKVIDVLLNWFKEHGQFPPKDMIFAAKQDNIPSSDAIEEVVQTRRLRDLIIQAVRAMTYEELSQVSLPASVVLRITRRTPGEDD
jgi:hypothetical protein